jgi:two-component system KDP operon response regulator KdpE
MDARAPASPSRVVIISARNFIAPEWRRRNLLPVRQIGCAADDLLAEPPDAILLDLSGSSERQQQTCWELCEIFQVSLVVLAEDAPPETVIRLLERGAAEVITDHADPLLMAARVAAILRRRSTIPAPSPSSVIALGGVQVDLVRRMVLRPDGARSLSRTEFSLLLALLRANGRACSHNDLIRHVWGPDQVSSPHYLRLYVRYLREKLEDDPRQPRLLLNVWGRGYRLNLDAVRPIALDGGKRAGSVPARPQALEEEALWQRGSSSLPPTSRTSSGRPISLRAASS